MASNTGATPEDSTPNTKDNHNHQDAMIEACKTGNIELLKQLFSAVGIKPGSPDVEIRWSEEIHRLTTIPASGPPATSTLICYAIGNYQVDIVAYLLTIYPTADIRRVFPTALAYLNLPIMKLLHASWPDIVNAEIDHGLSALQLACSEDNSDGAVAEFLLDHGADPEERAHGILYPLSLAVMHNQPLSVVRKIVERGGRVSGWDIRDAIQRRRFDVMRFFLKECSIARKERRSLRHALRKAGEEESCEESQGSEDEKLVGWRMEDGAATSSKGKGKRGWWEFWK